MKNNSRKSLTLAMFESIITAGLLSMAIMTPFYHSIGLTNSQISLSQSIFTVVMILLDLPMGWIADRFSRKWANIIGDFGHAIGFLIYANVHSFTGVVVAEIWLAIFGSLSAGVDISLIRHFSNKIDGSESVFKSKMAQVSLWQNISTMALVALGGPIGAISFRLAIALSSITLILGGIASIFIDDDSEKLVPVEKNPLKDLLRVVKECGKHPKLRLRIFVQAFGREMTHTTIWFFTPLMLAVGVPMEFVSLGWVLKSGTAALGTMLAKKFGTKLKDWEIMAIPIFVVCVGFGVVAVKISAITVPFYLLAGLSQGWTSATLKPMTQKYAKPSEQTSVSSFASTVGRIIYAIAGIIIGLAADLDLRLALLVNLIIFVPAGIVLTIKLKRER